MRRGGSEQRAAHPESEKTMSNGSSDMPDVRVTFYDNFVPSLKDGQYTVTLSQLLAVDEEQTKQDGGNPDVQSSPQPDVSQTFIVRGPRFQINPADVQRVFPPANGTGVYDEYLPMIVLNRRALPWERGLNLSAQQLQGLQPDARDATLYPWLALLVCTEDDLLIPQPPAGDTPPPPPNSQQNPTRTASFALANVVNATFNGTQTPGPPAGTLGPSFGLEDDEDPNQIFCNVIEMPAATFAALIPTLNDLRFLAHVRQVSTVNKTPQNTVHDGWYSCVISNRFAVPPPPPTSPPTAQLPQRNIAHLVALEGFESYLGTTAPITPAGFERVRLISLYGWTFDCQQDPRENYRQLMLNLISPTSEQGTDLLLRMPLAEAAGETPPVNAAQTTTLTRLRDGYVPLSYATQSGEQTFAWYRGPLSPVVAPRLFAPTSPPGADNPDIPRNASAAMIYDPATGLFDQSYAVAFQTGRSLALASQPFATNLMQWRRGAYALVDRLMEFMHSPTLSAILQSEGVLDADGNLTTEGSSDLAALLNSDVAADALLDYLATEFQKGVAGQIGRAGGVTPQAQSQATTNPPTKQPTVPADLRNLMQDPAVVSLVQQLSGLEPAGASPPQFEPGMMPQQIIEWLAQTALLYGVPFNNLVPNEQMLPTESIRFFYFDRNWIGSLLDGALSVGTQSSRDSLFQQLMREPLQRTVGETLAAVRAKFRGARAESSSPPAPPAGQIAGFVLRSAVVSGWPGLEVRAWSAADSTNPMQPLRLDRVAPTVMLGIFPDVPVKLEFNEPSEGLVFGVEDEGVALRFLPYTHGATADNVGQMIITEPDGPIWLTPSAIQQLARATPPLQPALKIAGTDGLVGALESLFAKFQKPSGAPQITLGPAALAVQMVRVPEQMLFLPEDRS